jgi:hypothetical protein
MTAVQHQLFTKRSQNGDKLSFQAMRETHRVPQASACSTKGCVNTGHHHTQQASAKYVAASTKSVTRLHRVNAAFQLLIMTHTHSPNMLTIIQRELASWNH